MNKMGYSLGEAGSQLSWNLVSSYLMVFYTDVVGLTPVIISLIMLAARIWDAVNDPMFGAVAENTRSKWGRFRPYILFGAPILALFSCLTFMNLNLSGATKAFWCAFTYIGCGMAYTAVSISVGCLANSMTVLNTERVKLNAFRGVASNIVQLIMNAATMPLILYWGNGSTSDGKGYLMAALIFSLASLPCFYVCFRSTKEIIGGTAHEKEKKQNVLVNLAASFRITLKDYNARTMILAMFLYLTGIFGRVGIMAYYFIYILKNPVVMAAFGTAYTVGGFLVNLYVPFLLNRFDKKKVAVLGALLQAACCAGFFFAGEAGLTGAVIVIGFFYGFTNMASLVAFGIGAEIIDDNWIRTGIRSDGVIYSCISFSTKLGNAIGGSVGILALGAVGFIANSEMSAQVLTKMNAIINFGPALFFILSAVTFGLIRMTNAKGKANEEKIKQMMESEQ